MTTKQIRLLWLAIIGAILSLSFGLFLYATQNWVSFALHPAEIASRDISPKQAIRLYGLVEKNSFKRISADKVKFIITLEGVGLAVQFQGALPSLFREGQGLIVEGFLLEKNLFTAKRILAKHDENYIPAELVDKLKSQGVWQGDNNDY